MSGTPRLLFVDDDLAVQRAFLRSLSGMPITIDCCNGVAEAMVAMQGTQYDVVATDMTMPDGTGVDVLHACADFLPNAARMVVSGDPNLGRVLAGIEVDEVIAKPWTSSTCAIASRPPLRAPPVAFLDVAAVTAV